MSGFYDRGNQEFRGHGNTGSLVPEPLIITSEIMTLRSERHEGFLPPGTAVEQFPIDKTILVQKEDTKWYELGPIFTVTPIFWKDQNARIESAITGQGLSPQSIAEDKKYNRITKARSIIGSLPNQEHLADAIIAAALGNPGYQDATVGAFHNGIKKGILISDDGVLDGDHQFFPYHVAAIAKLSLTKEFDMEFVSYDVPGKDYLATNTLEALEAFPSPESKDALRTAKPAGTLVIHKLVEFQGRPDYRRIGVTHYSTPALAADTLYAGLHVVSGTSLRVTTAQTNPSLQHINSSVQNVVPINRR